MQPFIAIFCLIIVAMHTSKVASAQSCDDVILVHENTSGEALRAIDAHHGVAIAAGSGGLVLHSDDGIHWTDLKSGTTDDFIDVVWAGDRFVLMANRPTMATIWTWDEVNGLVEQPNLISGVTGIIGHALGWSPPNLILAYFDIFFQVGRIRTTQDFVNLSNNDIELSWHCGEISDIETVNGVTVLGYECFDNGQSLRTGMYFSTNGIDYPSRGLHTGQSIGPRGLATNGAITLATVSVWVSGQGYMSYFYHSPTPEEPFTQYPEDGSLRTLNSDVAWVDPYFVGVGPIGAMILSSDGLKWYQVASPNQSYLNSVTPYGENTFLAVGYRETILLGQTERFSGLLENWPERADCRDIIARIQNCANP